MYICVHICTYVHILYKLNNIYVYMCTHILLLLANSDP